LFRAKNKGAKYWKTKYREKYVPKAGDRNWEWKELPFEEISGLYSFECFDGRTYLTL
jgi:hypothetical protein